MNRIDIIELNPYHPRPFVFSDIARCMRDGLRAAGLLSDIRTTIGPSGVPCVLLGSPEDLMACADAMAITRARVAVANFEQLGSTSVLLHTGYEDWLAQQLVIDYHSANIARLAQSNPIALRAYEWPLMPSTSVVYPVSKPEPERIDVLFYGSMNARRKCVLDALIQKGLRVRIVRGAYGHELAPALEQTQLVLHVHYYDTSLFPIARMLQPIARGVPVVSEQSIFSTHSDWSSSGIAFAPYQDLVERCLQLLARPHEQIERVRRSLAFAAQPSASKYIHALAAQLC